ncbi:hypothetical protein acdb102_28810 [Acidothermaceae bacterium B102]|nr:hypothetical protein acdb102_28810 [Acidothermaceae bacterium B102]
MSRHARSGAARPNLVAMAATLGSVGLLVATALLTTAAGDNHDATTPKGPAATPWASPLPSASAVPPGVVHAAAPAQAAADPYALPAEAVQPEPCPVPSHPGHKPPPVHHTPTPIIPLDSIPKPWPVPAHTPDLAAVSGKGMWLTTWKTSHVDVPGVVAQAKAAGLTSLWVRTGGSKQGYYGDALLHALLPAAHAAGLKVIAWDFPAMSDPARDAIRARAALKYTVDGQQIDGFSPDIETINEGTFNNPKRVSYYLSLVRRAARGRPVVATVMRPTDEQLAKYPYAAMAPYIDAYAPMDYWSCQEPGDLTLRSIQALASFGKPVTVIGQAYDMADEGGRPGVPTAAETWRFLDSAKRAGAIGASLWTYETSGPAQWVPLARYPW